jgi:hypothetical protein
MWNLLYIESRGGDAGELSNPLSPFSHCFLWYLVLYVLSHVLLLLLHVVNFLVVLTEKLSACWMNKIVSSC